MDAADLFKKIGFGAKFNLKRFQHDAEKLRIPLQNHSQKKKTLNIVNFRCV